VLAAGTLALAVFPAQDPATRSALPGTIRDPWHLVVESSATGRTPAGEALLSVAAAELALGRLTQARRLLASPSAAAADSLTTLTLRAELAEAGGAAAEAARLYAWAAGLSSDVGQAGALLARSAVASERGGVAGAAERYAEARARLPAIAGWLALRQARITADPQAAEALITLAPVPARRPAQLALAEVKLRVADTAAAMRLLVEGGRPDRAAVLALARADTGGARAHAVTAVASTDTAVQRAGLAVLDGPAEAAPGEADDWRVAAAAAARLGEAARAARLAARAVARGDSGPGMMLRWGTYLERAGRRSEAMTAYARAGRSGEFPRARARLQSGDRVGGIGALRAFADHWADDPQAPLALYLAADAADSDSLLAAVAERWPASDYGTRARQRLAMAHLSRRDTVGALRHFEAGARAGASDAPLSQFHAGRLLVARGDSAGRALLERVARTDSLGYYGFQARAALRMAPPRFAPVPDRPVSPRARAVLDEIALLEAAGLTDEADLLVAHVTDRPWEDADEMLDVSLGLTHSGRSTAGIRLAWRASTRLTLNHPRVLRAVFPWPNRELIEREAAKFNLDPYALAGLIRHESGFAAAIRSRAGAVGAMQLMPATAREVARRQRVPWSDGMRAVFDANVHIGSAHLAGLLARYKGDLIPTFAAYNAGGTPVSRWLRAPGAGDRVILVEQIRYAETQGYVRTVWRNGELYRALYGPDALTGGP
jgi:soluble lytic murein transglycosylase